MLLLLTNHPMAVIIQPRGDFMANMEVFPRRLEEARRNKDLTQKKLAEAVKVSPQTISAYEKSGEKGKTPSLEIAIDIAKELGVSLDWLFGLEVPKQEEGKKIESLGDVYRELAAIVDGTDDTEITVETEKREQLVLVRGLDYYDVQYEHVFNDVPYVRINIFDATLAAFYQHRETMQKLLNDGVIDDSLYASWETGAIAKLDNEASFSALFRRESADADDNLPF